MKQWWTPQELAGLPGQAITPKGCREKADREGWQFQKRAGTKAREYLFSALPQETQAALVAASLKACPVVPVVQEAQLPVPVATAAELATWQRECAAARLAFVREVERLAVVIGKNRAVAELIERAKAGTLPEQLQQLVRVANAKAGESRALSRSRIFEWCSATADAEKSSRPAIAALAPRARVSEVPTWAPALLKCWAQPQKPPLTDVLMALAQQLPADQLPNYHQASRFLTQRMGKVDVMRGRMGPRELKKIRPFVRRSTDSLWATDIYTADGHTFDAEVAHPRHGRPFRPEVTGIVDVKTRRLVGWSCDLAESRWAVLDAIRAACCNFGIPAVFYVDNGSGYKNDMLSSEAVGLMARMGTEIRHSIAYNSQARGIIERSHKSIWVRAAKKLPTYMGEPMDAEARKKVFRLTRSDIKDVGKSRLLMSWEAFVAFIEAEAEAYNNRPHRGLEKVRDVRTGLSRHMTPKEAWDGEHGNVFEAVVPSPEEADDLFRPYAIASVRRGEITLFKNRYFSRDLEQYHGEEVQAGYDIHDPACIWVRDMNGRFLCRAELEANSKPYMPQSVIEQARDRRESGRLRRAQDKIDEIMQERRPAALLEQLERVDIPGLDITRAGLAQRFVEIAALEPDNTFTATPSQRAIHVPADAEQSEPINHALEGQRKYLRWHRINEEKERGEALAADDLEFWGWFQDTQAFRTWQRYYGNDKGLLQQALG